MNTGKFFSIFFILTLFSLSIRAQFSIATDISFLRNFDGKQPFTVVGQTIHSQWHLEEKFSLYAFYTYHSNGKYTNSLTATARSSSTQPQTINFFNRSEMRLRHFSVGVMKYFSGTFKKLEKFNLYGKAGFGLVMGTAFNNFSVPVDTSLYTVQNNVVSGSGEFKRLTLDLSPGFEFPLGYEIFVFSEARVHIPTTSYPNKYLLKNSNAPFLGSFNIGIRILFNYER